MTAVTKTSFDKSGGASSGPSLRTHLALSVVKSSEAYSDALGFLSYASVLLGSRAAIHGCPACGGHGEPGTIEFFRCLIIET